LRERFPKTEAEIGRDLVIPHAKDTRRPRSRRPTLPDKSWPAPEQSAQTPFIFRVRLRQQTEPAFGGCEASVLADHHVRAVRRSGVAPSAEPGRDTRRGLRTMAAYSQAPRSVSRASLMPTPLRGPCRAVLYRRYWKFASIFATTSASRGND